MHYFVEFVMLNVTFRVKCVVVPMPIGPLNNCRRLSTCVPNIDISSFANWHVFAVLDRL